MAIPTQNQIHRPFLEIVSSWNEQDLVSIGQIIDLLIRHFYLTESDVENRYPSGRSKFKTNAYSAASLLRRANLVHSPSRATFQITPQGRKILADNQGEITSGVLMRLIGDRQQNTDHSLFVDSHTAEIKEHPDSFLTVCYDSVVDTPDKQTIQSLGAQEDILVSTAMSELNPYEQLEEVYRELRDSLADELLIVVKEMSPARFETLVVNLLERMGYGEGRSVGRSGDEGIDGIINQDPLGLEKVYIQAKRWQSQVGEPEIRNFSGSLEAKGASKGVFITTSAFSSTARQTAQYISAGSKFIRLIDGNELASLMIRHGVGVVTEMTYEVKKIDENYFVDL